MFAYSPWIFLNESSSETSFRDWFILRYVDQLSADDALWRLAVHYLSFAGSEGQERIKQMLLRVQYADPAAPSKQSPLFNGDKSNGDMAVDDEPESATETTAEDVIKAAYDYGLHDVATQLCRVSSLDLCWVDVEKKSRL